MVIRYLSLSVLLLLFVIGSLHLFAAAPPHTPVMIEDHAPTHKAASPAFPDENSPS